jgi:hypothetical protein
MPKKQPNSSAQAGQISGLPFFPNTKPSYTFFWRIAQRFDLPGASHEIIRRTY